MAKTNITQVALEYIGGGSDKLYVIQVNSDVTGGATTYTADCFYGRRGGSLSLTTKYSGPSKASAEAAARKMETEKRGKGYDTHTTTAGKAVVGMPSTAPIPGAASVPSASGATTTTAPAKPVITGPAVMLAEDVADEAEVEALMRDPNWCMQRKYDGERVPVSIRRSGLEAFNRKGIARALTTGAETELKRLVAKPDFSDERETLVDGELMGEVYVIYDLLTLRDNDVRRNSFEERYSALEVLLESDMGLLAPTAWSEEEKRAMLAKAMEEEWEGVIFRNLDSPYEAGKSLVLKRHKLWATATCRVLTANSTRRSIQVAVRDESDNEVFIGNVTVPVNQDVPEPDDLVEVRYLYVGNGGSLYQPTLLRVRTDVEHADLRSGLRPAPPEKRGEFEVTPAAATVSDAEFV